MSKDIKTYCITLLPGYHHSNTVPYQPEQIYPESSHKTAISLISTRAMAQAMLEMKRSKYNCYLCYLGFKSETGLNYYMKKKHVLDTDSDLHCFTYKKVFTKRDLIDNHYKTVAHQLECKKLKLEEVKMTKIKEDLEYRRRLFEMNNFKPRPCTPGTWKTEATVMIPFNSKEDLQDPRRKPTKCMIPSISEIPEMCKKTEIIEDLNT